MSTIEAPRMDGVRGWATRFCRSFPEWWTIHSLSGGRKPAGGTVHRYRPVYADRSGDAGERGYSPPASCRNDSTLSSVLRR